MTDFNFFLQTKIIFGVGSAKTLQEILAQCGERHFIISSKNTYQILLKKKLLASIKSIVGVFNEVEAEPSVETVLVAFEEVSKAKSDCIVAIGGGSVIDVAKSIALLATNKGPLQKYEENNTVKNKPLPVIALPTTAGSGSEVTRYAVLVDKNNSRKFTIKSDLICPIFAIIDPKLCLSTPKDISSASGLDALIHGLEAYLSKKSQPLADILAEKVIQLTYSNLPRVIKNPSDLDARTNMSLAALLGGIIINNVRTGMMHTMSLALAGHTKIPHGFGNSLFLKPILEFNKNYIEKKLLKIGILVEIEKNNSSSAVINKLYNLTVKAGIPKNMSTLGITSDHIPLMVARILQDKGLHDVNPRKYVQRDLRTILMKVL